MMYTTNGVHTPDALPLSCPQDAFPDDASLQWPSSQSVRKLPKGSSGQQRVGKATRRVYKPKSTSISPKCASMAGRRRTMMGNDVWTPQRQQQVLEYFSAQPGQTPSRPASWHPSTYLPRQQQQAVVPHQPCQQHQRYLPPQRQQQYTAYVVPTPSLYGADYTEMYAGQPQFSPVTCYSNNTSPSSTFSPLPMFPACDQVHYTQGAEANEVLHSDPVYSTDETLGMTESFAPHNQVDARNAAAGDLDWNSYMVQGFSNTTPPTPEGFSSGLLRQAPAVPQAYEPLDEPPEEEGEILFGMGLYDTPDKADEDPQLNHYRSTVSSLWGPPCRSREATGKGLKLEETWEPPTKTDDDADGDDEEDDDG